jgi:hypothetical protein
METYITIVIAIGGIATGIGAIWTAMVARRQLGEQRRLLEEDADIARRQAKLMEETLIQQRESLQSQNERARVSLEVEVMYKLWKQWESRTFQGYRQQSMQHVLDHFFVDGELREVKQMDSSGRLLFDFFDEIGYLTRSGVVSIERVTSTFGRPLRLGWALFESAIKVYREESSTPYRYANCENLYHRILDYDQARGGTGNPPTKADLEHFVKRQPGVRLSADSPTIRTDGRGE